MADAYMSSPYTSTSADRGSVTNSDFSSRSRKRQSVASDETGESSKKQHIPSYIRNESPDVPNSSPNASNLQTPKEKGWRRRSHKSSSSNSFLLGKSLQAPSVATDKDTYYHRKRDALHDPKGKRVVRAAHNEYHNGLVPIDLSTDGSLREERDNRTSSSSFANKTSTNDNVHGDERASDVLPPGVGISPPVALDIDSKLIVNLALGLSEGRRNAQRRIVSMPYSPAMSSTKTEGSLGQYIQQRRVSRNMSPRAGRVDSTFTASPTTRRRVSAVLSIQDDSQTQYEFSASTLARAEKARVHIELMAQYRRVLQYVPPLRPGNLSRTSTSNTAISVKQPPLGREYNPLQYIRNRTVRARERKTIDGVTEGFGDVDCVKMWVDEISKRAAGDSTFLVGDNVPLPRLRHMDGSERPVTGSSLTIKSPTKRAQSRVGWITEPADMLAEVYWLEQGDNKTSIEDNHWRKIYPQSISSHRRSGTLDRQIHSRSSDGIAGGSAIIDFELGSNLPALKSVRNSEPHFVPDGSLSRIRHKLHLSDARSHVDHKLSHFGRSKASISDSDSEKHVRRERRATVAQADVLEKQMRAILAKEAQEGLLAAGKQSADKPTDKYSVPQQIGTNAAAPASVLSDDSRQGSGRSSLETSNLYSSGHPDDTLQSAGRATLVNSATSSANRPETITPSQSREGSPIRTAERTPLERLRSKLPFTRDVSPERSQLPKTARQGLVRMHTAPSSPTSPTSPPSPARTRRLSKSPTRRLIPRRTDESFRSTKSTLSQRRDLEPSGIRGLFKSSRNNVSRIGDIIWKKDSANVSVFDSSDDEASEGFDLRPGANDSISPIKNRQSLELPSFTSAFERHGGERRVRSDENGSPQKPHAGRAETRNLPRINVHRSSPSAQTSLHDQGRYNRPSNVNVRSESNRLNDMLGLSRQTPGKGYDDLPVTGLSVFDQRRPRSVSRHWSGESRRSPSTSLTHQVSDYTNYTRIRTLLMSCGVKASEIVRRSHEVRDITEPDTDPIVNSVQKDVRYASVVKMNRDDSIVTKPMPRTQEHVMAAKILASDIQLSSLHWQQTATHFSSTTIPALVSTIQGLQIKIMGQSAPFPMSPKSFGTDRKSTEPEGLSGINKQAADEADLLSRELVEVYTLKVKVLNEKIERLLRRRRQRFRWLRRSGWVLLEWFLVAIMWFVWALVTVWKAGSVGVLGVVRLIRWLLWLD